MIRAVAVALGLVLVLAPAGAAARRAPRGERAVRDEVVVRFRDGVGAPQRVAARARAGVRAVRASRLPGVQVVRAGGPAAVAEAVRELELDPRVRYAAPNLPRRPYATPDDPLFDRLWGLSRIAAPAAWDLAVGDPSVVVGVVDEGIARAHPDLAPNVVPGGYDFFDGDADPDDPDGHGTHVAGIIGAAGNNAAGMTGLVWRAGLLPVRALGPDGADAATVAEGMDYAAAEGARIVNLSLGGPGPDPAGEDAIRRHPGVLFVAAAGNDGADNDAPPPAPGDFPCNNPLPNVICVAATDELDQLAGFSNYGRSSVDLGAPGVDVLSAAIESVRLDEQFERGALTGWTAGAPWRWESDPASGFASTGSFGAGAAGSLTAESGVDLAIGTDCRLRYAVRYELGGGAGVSVEASTDRGATWSALRRYAATRGNDPATTGGEWRRVAVGLAELAGEPDVRLRFRLDAGAGAGSFAADEVAVACTDFDEHSYVAMSGTSMAAPHVAGAAALVLALAPSSDVADVRDALLRSGDPLPSLVGRTVTGRRLNVARALDMLGLPGVVTGGATEVTATSARVGGTVDPRGAATEWLVEYGPTAGYGLQAPAAPQPAGAGSSPVPVGTQLSGLTPATAYHYRVVALRAGARYPGSDATFTTAPAPPPPPPAPTVVGLQAAPAAKPGAQHRPRLGDKPKLRCAVRRHGRRIVRLRCVAQATYARSASIRVVRAGRTVARGAGPTRRTIALRLVRRASRGRHVAVVTFRSASGRRAVRRLKLTL